MLRKYLSVFAALAVMATLCITGQAQEINSPVGAKHVIWIGSDGFGAHYVNWDELPNLKRMKENGAWTLHMRSVLPSSSAINWETQLVGAPSESHGYRTWGSKEPDLPPIFIGENGRFPDVFYVIKQAIPDAKTSCVYSWDGIGYLYDKAAVDTDKFVQADLLVRLFQRTGRRRSRRWLGNARISKDAPNDRRLCRQTARRY